MASNVVIRPIGLDERADWEPLWNGPHPHQLVGLVRPGSPRATNLALFAPAPE
jgi:hypothetical protein